MDTIHTVLALAALAQSTRLDAYRFLVAQEPHGAPAGDIARHLAIPHNTASSHLAVLSRASLVTSRRESRSVIYRADLNRLQSVVTYLLRDCCGGRSELCAPIVEALTPCCEKDACC